MTSTSSRSTLKTSLPFQRLFTARFSIFRPLYPINDQEESFLSLLSFLIFHIYSQFICPNKAYRMFEDNHPRVDFIVLWCEWFNIENLLHWFSFCIILTPILFERSSSMHICPFHAFEIVKNFFGNCKKIILLYCTLQSNLSGAVWWTGHKLSLQNLFRCRE